ncbi:MAG TPA: hypothetical protein VM345_19465 [Acidimicrobiales bacterium]|nr:hypothetical protein [Acidimicrobiales bacterium]
MSNAVHGVETSAPLARCFRGHLTPAGKTFCESCGASLDVKVSSDVIPDAPRRRWLVSRRKRD